MTYMDTKLMNDAAINTSSSSAMGWLDAKLIDLMPAAVYVCAAPSGLIVRYNERAAELWGRRPHLGETDEHFCGAYRLFWIDGTPLPHANTPMAQVLKTGEPVRDQDVMIERPDGSRVMVIVNIDVIRDDQQNIVGAVNVLKDVTERKKTEARLAHVQHESERLRRLYETILATIPDFVYIFDLNFRYTYANDALLKMLGKTWDEAIGKTCLELGYPAWHAAKHDRELTQVLTTGRPVQDEVPFIGTHGLRIYDYIFVPVFGANGEIEAIAGTTRDVTERKHMEQELQSRAEELAEADRKKDEFIALLAHELRNPLAPVRNGLRILELAENDPQTLSQVRLMMERQLTHMVRLIDDLLDVSRMNRNKLHLQKHRVSLQEVINNAVEATRPAIEAANHSLTVSLPDKPIFLDADLTRLAQVFSNLLSNSAKYTKPGGKIWLIAEPEGDQLIVEVRDNGIGIPAASLPNIFDMFSQVPSDSDHCTDGLGIGLALVKALVEMHQGSVSASSDGPDKGSIFRVTLPILSAVVDVQPEPRVQDIHAPDQPKRRILIVDDNHDACDSMAMLLNLLGHDVRIAHDGFEALECVKEFAPHIVLMDVGMPNLNGYDATRLIREQTNGKAITIVAVTGWGQEGDRTQSRAAGCDGHLVKPVNLKDIEDLLRDLKLREEKVQIHGETML